MKITLFFIDLKVMDVTYIENDKYEFNALRDGKLTYLKGFKPRPDLPDGRKDWVHLIMLKENKTTCYFDII